MSIRPIQNKVITSDSLEYLKLFNDYQADILFCDPPYALGSEVIIRQDGKVDYKKASDFMNKWEMPTGEYWEKWFIEAYRILKHGGYLIMYGMDRQLLLFKYYASLAGFQEQQSIYWYYISNFPKATDLSKMIDKNAGVEREQLEPSPNARPNSLKEENLYKAGTVGKEFNLTSPSTELAKKYDGYKYSISPLKQTCETIMVFKKPNKTGSVLHDTLAMENGDDTITCSALNIDGNRVGYDMNDTNPATNPRYRFENGYKIPEKGQKSNGTSNFTSSKNDINLDGRYPSQTFIDSQVAEKLDLQSGLNVGQKGATTGKEPSANKQGRLYNDYSGYGKPSKPRNDFGGCSKILHKCDYEKIDFDLFIYNPKVSGRERNKGLDNMEDKVLNRMREDKGEPTGLNKESRFAPTIVKNNHPTLKPIELNKKILKLFKTPNEQVIIYPFAGSGSEIIGGHKANFRNWFACEVNDNYTKIANARIKYFEENDYEQISLFDE
jgi:DNA modification methylase